jgi:hypothetical protein
MQWRGMGDRRDAMCRLLLVFIIDHLPDACLDDEFGAFIAREHGHVEGGPA